jgi:hypothetical protein
MFRLGIHTSCLQLSQQRPCHGGTQLMKLSNSCAVFGNVSLYRFDELHDYRLVSWLPMHPSAADRSGKWEQWPVTFRHSIFTKTCSVLTSVYTWRVAFTISPVAFSHEWSHGPTVAQYAEYLWYLMTSVIIYSASVLNQVVLIVSNTSRPTSIYMGSAQLLSTIVSCRPAMRLSGCPSMQYTIHSLFLLCELLPICAWSDLVWFVKLQSTQAFVTPIIYASRSAALVTLEVTIVYTQLRNAYVG